MGNETAAKNKTVVNESNSLDDSAHFIIQAKGGIGKSLAASLLAQYFKRSGAEMRGYDTDQLNTTFAQYKDLGITLINILDDAASIDPRKFDALIEKLLVPGGVAVIDTGSNSYIAMLSYLFENDVFDLLKANNKRVFLHIVVAGGDNYMDTLHSFNQVAAQVDVPLVLWTNEFFGLLENNEGVAFADSNEFKTNREKIKGVVLMEKFNPQTYGVDIKKMAKERITIAQVQASEKYNIMEKQRIKIFSDPVFTQLQAIQF